MFNSAGSRFRASHLSASRISASFHLKRMVNKQVIEEKIQIIRDSLKVVLLGRSSYYLHRFRN